MAITLAGHSRAHFPQPTHFSSLTRAVNPCTISMERNGHTFTQQPQATQCASSTIALRRFLAVSMLQIPPSAPRFRWLKVVPLLYRKNPPRFCDNITKRGGRQISLPPAIIVWLLWEPYENLQFVHLTNEDEKSIIVKESQRTILETFGEEFHER